VDCRTPLLRFGRHSRGSIRHQVSQGCWPTRCAVDIGCPVKLCHKTVNRQHTYQKSGENVLPRTETGVQPYTGTLPGRVVSDEQCLRSSMDKIIARSFPQRDSDVGHSSWATQAKVPKYKTHRTCHAAIHCERIT
jgi:hypothetical protein